MKTQCAKNQSTVSVRCHYLVFLHLILGAQVQRHASDADSNAQRHELKCNQCVCLGQSVSVSVCSCVILSGKVIAAHLYTVAPLHLGSSDTACRRRRRKANAGLALTRSWPRSSSLITLHTHTHTHTHKSRVQTTQRDREMTCHTNRYHVRSQPTHKTDCIRGRVTSQPHRPELCTRGWMRRRLL
jgi:hypothetical protein